LTRSIQALGSVQSARVHLALPNQNGFFRDQQKPSASVLLTLNGGRTLDRSQLAGIIHLVSSSVPEMDPKSVSVLDATGKLLSTPPDGEAGVNGGDAQQLQHVQQIEQLYSSRILDILEPVVGRQNVRAQVTAELDFSQTESTSELFKPNQTPDATAIRSQQLMESGAGAGSGALATGVPGATTNQPPGQTGAAINGAPQALAAAGAASGAGNGRRESIINYEVDKTVRVVRGSTGMIKRISAAVVLNHKTSTDAKGKVTTAAMSDAELEKMTTLVRETIGFSKDRGDSVNVVTAPFTLEKPTIIELPIWQQPEVLDLARSLAWPLGTLLFGALVLMGAVRPALKVLAETPAVHHVTPAATLDALESDQPERPLLTGPSAASAAPAEPDPGEISLEEARKLTRDNPAAVANIVKTWINGEAPA
jgi:flagellar M-ring protein FliF